MRTQPSSRVRILAPGVGEVEASLIVEEGTELIVMLRDAKAFVESHFSILFELIVIFVDKWLPI